MSRGIDFETDLACDFPEPPPLESLPKSGLLTLVSVVLIAGGLASVFAKTASTGNQTLWIVVMVGLFGTGGVGVAIAATRANKRMVAKRATELRSLGIPTRSLETKERPTFFAQIAHLDEWLKNGTKGLTIIGQTTIDTERGPVSVRVFHHTYTVNTGKNSTTIHHWAATAPAGANWPMLRLTGENFLTKLTKKLGASDIQLDNQAFNDKWVVKCDSEDFAIVALAPGVQEFLTDAPNNEAWALGKGAVACIRRGWLKPAEVRTLAERAASLRARIPEDLDAF